MKLSIIVGAIAALITGIAIVIQSTIASRAGSMIGDIRTGLLTNFLGGAIAGVILILIMLREGTQTFKISGAVIGLVAVAGLLGIFIITGISFSLQRAGIAAGLASAILGQLVLSMIIDTYGIGGVEAVPLTFNRILGLLMMGVGVILLLPRN